MFIAWFTGVQLFFFFFFFFVFVFCFCFLFLFFFFFAPVFHWRYSKLSMIFFLLINVKMPIIVDISLTTFLSKKNTCSIISEPEKSLIS